MYARTRLRTRTWLLHLRGDFNERRAAEELFPTDITMCVHERRKQQQQEIVNLEELSDRQADGGGRGGGHRDRQTDRLTDRWRNVDYTLLSLMTEQIFEYVSALLRKVDES